MFYFQFSALSPQDLEGAKNRVPASLSSKDMQINFLISHSKWTDALNRNYMEEMNRIADEKPEDAKQSLIKLTQKIVQLFNS